MVYGLSSNKEQFSEKSTEVKKSILKRKIRTGRKCRCEAKY